MKKLVMTALTMLVLTVSSPLSANAMFPSQAQINLAESEEVAPTAEQTEWYYRVNEDGVPQMRLWSITRGIWLTDWIDV